MEYCERRRRKMAAKVRVEKWHITETETLARTFVGIFQTIPIIHNNKKKMAYNKHYKTLQIYSECGGWWFCIMDKMIKINILNWYDTLCYNLLWCSVVKIIERVEKVQAE